MKPAYSFHKQLAEAKPREAKVVSILKQRIAIFKDLKHCPEKTATADAYSKKQDEWVEIKVDTTQYPNHFVERFSSKHEAKDGGPWQYQAKGVKYYVFYYLKQKEVHVFETSALISLVEKLLKSGKISETKHGKDVHQWGGKYVTYGYAIPKELLKEIELFNFKV